MQSQLIRHLLSVDPRYRATIYDVAHHPWVFGEEADEMLTNELASSIGGQSIDSSKDRESTESSDTESESKPAVVAVKPTSILKGTSQDSDTMVAMEQPHEEPTLVQEQPKVSNASKDSDSDSPSSPVVLQAKGLPQVKGVIQNETDSFLSLASSTATLPSEGSSAISDDSVFVSADVFLPAADVVKRRPEHVKAVKTQRPATVGALYSDLPSPRTLVNQLIGEDTIFECSEEEKRASARLSKRISCGKYSKITELWESIFNESHHLQAMMSSKSPKSGSGSDESPGSSSSEDLLEILNSKHLKKSYSSSFKLTRHSFSSHRRSMRTHKEMVIMEAHQLQMRSESLFEKPEFRKGTRDSGLGDDLENLAKVYQKALEISSSVN